MITDQEYSQRAYKVAIAGLLGAFKALRTQTGSQIQQVVQRTVGTIKHQLQAGQSVKQKTYADAAAQPNTQKLATNVVTIYVADTTERQEISRLTGKEIVERIGQKGVIAARAGQGGVIRIFTA